MDAYDYRASVTEDIEEYIKENINLEEYAGDRNRLESDLNDKLFVEDSVTGNASGSYTFNAYKAEEYLCHNLDILAEALREFGTEGAEYEKYLYSPESADVTIRCYLLGECIGYALDNIEQELGIDLDDERCFEKTVGYEVTFPEGTSAEDIDLLKSEFTDMFDEDAISWADDNSKVEFKDVTFEERENIEDTMTRYNVSYDEYIPYDINFNEREFIILHDEASDKFNILERSWESQSFVQFVDEDGNCPSFETREDAEKYLNDMAPEKESPKKEKKTDIER